MNIKGLREAVKNYEVVVQHDSKNKVHELVREYRLLFQSIQDAKDRINDLENEIKREAELTNMQMRELRRKVKNEGRDTVSSVYFIEMVGQQSMKIGRAENTKKRLASMQAHSPCDLRVLGTIPGGRKVEWHAHNFFAAYQIRGEWFEYNHATSSMVRDILKRQSIPDVEVSPFEKNLLGAVTNERFKDYCGEA